MEIEEAQLRAMLLECRSKAVKHQLNQARKVTQERRHRLVSPKGYRRRDCKTLRTYRRQPNHQMCRGRTHRAQAAPGGVPALPLHHCGRRRKVPCPALLLRIA
ncbi:hypothetical protein TGARI_296121A [Toxoplasma gondii ARI]|uniref:Uncharacterized protein n=1 Tax=Toxoplasma gondii ARI TaxID=1074872 RepID=A0A139XXT9_TOXGO|nr:hypothetical protein TGARI_296121A [Toxoplasma gondii ARI]